jgi:dimethylargininase
MSDFSNAIVRKPGPNFSEGQTSQSADSPVMEKVIAQHMDYVWTLFSLDLEVELLDADPRFPDSCFVEDTAVITERCAVICRPGHASRQGEQEEIAGVLSNSFTLEQIVEPGTVDGGDVCRVGDHYLIGLSLRTNAEGARQLGEILARYGYISQTVPVVEALHLKSGMSWLGGNTLLVTPAYAAREELSGYELLTLSPEESYAANCLYVNGNAVISSGFPKLKKMLQDRGFGLMELNMSEFRKMDGSLTCLSLLW